MSDKKRKRPFPAEGSAPTNDAASKKPKKGAPYDPKSNQVKGKLRPKKHSVAPLKKRIRDVRRQLERGENMPVGLRVEHERELAELERDLLVTEAEIQKQDNTGKYHMVRFFDRKKAERFLKKIERRINASDPSDDQERLQTLRHRAQVDLNYTRFFPLACTYISLYPKQVRDEEKDADKLVERQKGDKIWWEKVEQATRDGTLQVLREGLYTKDDKPLDQASTEQMPKRDSKTTRPKQKSSEANLDGKKKRTGIADGEDTGGDGNNDSDSDGSGGGFFERP